MLHKKNKIKVEYVQFYGVSKRMAIFVVKLKTIKY